MKKIVTLILALMLGVCGITAFAACDGEDDLIGFDIDLARAVADELGVELETRLISWEARRSARRISTIRDFIWKTSRSRSSGRRTPPNIRI